VHDIDEHHPLPGTLSHVRWSFAPEPTVPGAARQRLTDVFARWGVGVDDTDEALLVINELVANAVEHARTPLILTVSLTGRTLLVEVADESADQPRLQPIDHQAARGRGLQFVDALAHRWGWNEDAAGKTVWAEIASFGPRSVQPAEY
jgi:anti-sigma regulatory factor (Ser/Thr protein kinase)